MAGHAAGMTGAGEENVAVLMTLKIEGYTNMPARSRTRIIFMTKERALKKNPMIVPEKRNRTMVYTGTIPLL